MADPDEQKDYDGNRFFYIINIVFTTPFIVATRTMNAKKASLVLTMKRTAMQLDSRKPIVIFIRRQRNSAMTILIPGKIDVA